MQYVEVTFDYRFEEDYLFDRTFWNTGLVPYLIPQLKCDKQAWRFWSSRTKCGA